MWWFILNLVFQQYYTVRLIFVLCCVFPANFSNGSKRKPNYFWCDHFKLEKTHQSLTFIINFNHKKKKKWTTFFIGNWHSFLSNLSTTHNMLWSKKKIINPLFYSVIFNQVIFTHISNLCVLQIQWSQQKLTSERINYL